MVPLKRLADVIVIPGTEARAACLVRRLGHPGTPDRWRSGEGSRSTAIGSWQDMQPSRAPDGPAMLASVMPGSRHRDRSGGDYQITPVVADRAAEDLLEAVRSRSRNIGLMSVSKPMGSVELGIMRAPFCFIDSPDRSASSTGWTSGLSRRAYRR